MLFKFITILKRRFWIHHYKKLNFKNIGKSTVLDNGISFLGEKYISIGNDCFLGSNSILQCFDRYRNTKYIPCLSIGNNVSVTRRITVYCAASITIGNDVLIGSDVLITDENHGMDPRNHYSDNALLTKSVVIGNNVWIGDKAVILPGVTIGDGVIIGAGSVVTKPIPPFCICAGNPAKVLKIWNSANERWESI